MEHGMRQGVGRRPVGAPPPGLSPSQAHLLPLKLCSPGARSH